jgi:hypothetical protein
MTFVPDASYLDFAATGPDVRIAHMRDLLSRRGSFDAAKPLHKRNAHHAAEFPRRPEPEEQLRAAAALMNGARF